MMTKHYHFSDSRASWMRTGGIENHAVLAKEFPTPLGAS